MNAHGWKQLALAAGLGFSATCANADLIATIDGNDCAGVFGIPFASCKIPTQYDSNQSPVIAKFDVSDTTGNFLAGEFNTLLFPSLTGSEFSFSNMSSNKGTGTWTYTPGPGDPLIRFYAAKAANNFNLFSNLGDPNADVWVTPLNQQGAPRGLSHITFYDTGGGGPPTGVPEPASLLLAGLGLLAASLGMKRKVHRSKTR